MVSLVLASIVYTALSPCFTRFIFGVSRSLHVVLKLIFFLDTLIFNENFLEVAIESSIEKFQVPTFVARNKSVTVAFLFVNVEVHCH